MKQQSSLPRLLLFIFCALWCAGLMLSSAAAPRAFAQTVQMPQDAERQHAIELWEQSKFTEALPLLEKLAAKNGDDIAILSRLGFAIYATTAMIKDPQERQQRRSRALTILQHSQELGDDSNLTKLAVDALSSNDPTDIPFSKIREAEQAIRDGEAAFVKGELDKALAHYERALRLDPKLYEAALYAGDMYFKKGYAATDPAVKSEQMNKAGEWFARAIAITQDRETAHRYWGDALMALGKQDEARAKFVEAIIAEPYNRGAYVGLTQWAEHNNVSLGHPQIKVPDEAGAEAAGNWTIYKKTREAWADGRFNKEFPTEKAYRHSLREEAEALRLVAEAAAKESQSDRTKSLDPSLASLVKLNQAGLLEAYILFAHPDAGIARDYAAYRQANRDKLRRYWKEFVIQDKQTATP
ncbi:MAG TPA: tetratricopeptide repeat protein [Pyrinomonadaceae bacterium]|nr:tetratricopeptide repeat protein [Pyrinomonadaceae bacterium]